ncbi:MAG: SPASM domain-containing protein [Planctomycetota bacterium]
MWEPWNGKTEALFYPQPGECYEPWQTFMTSLDGSVYTCCRGGEVMGNLLEQDFQEIWNGEKYRAYRRNINSFRPPQACMDCPVKMG